MKNFILHNVRLQQADRKDGIRVGTENDSKEMQQKIDSKMTEEMAVVITENVFKQMGLIVEQDTEFSPLTEEDYRRIKNFEAEAEKDASDPDIKQYLLNFIELEAEGGQTEHPPQTKIASNSQCHGPCSQMQARKRTSHGKSHRGFQHQQMIYCHQDPYRAHHRGTKTHRGITKSATSSRHQTTGTPGRVCRMR